MTKPIKLVSEPSATNYTVAVPLNWFIRLTDAERKRPLDDHLADRLDKLMGVYDTDYSGHYGSHIFFKLEKEYDTPETHEAIHKLIKDCCKR